MLYPPELRAREACSSDSKRLSNVAATPNLLPSAKLYQNCIKTPSVGPNCIKTLHHLIGLAVQFLQGLSLHLQLHLGVPLEYLGVALPEQEVARNSVESKRPSELIGYAATTPFAIGFLETAFTIEDSSMGI